MPRKYRKNARKASLFPKRSYFRNDYEYITAIKNKIPELKEQEDSLVIMSMLPTSVRRQYKNALKRDESRFVNDLLDLMIRK